MSLQSPIARARGLGSAKEGLHHWWMQRVTAVVMVPLTLWFVFAVAARVGAGYEAVAGWIANPCVAVALVIYFGALFYHSALGVQVVVEDYVHHGTVKTIALFANKLAHLVFGVAAVMAVLRIALA